MTRNKQLNIRRYCTQGKHTKAVAERIVEAFRNPEQLPKALVPVFIHRKDDKPCRQWSWHNQLVVALCGSVDARGFRQWKQVNRNVKKGAKALWILAPCVKKLTEKDEGGDEKTRQVVYGFRSVPVFALEDTEGEPLPESDDKYDSWAKELPFLEVAEEWDVHVDTFTHHGGNPLGYYQYGRSGSQAIMLGTENLSTWAHEMVHAADHRVRSLKEAKWHKEIVAELGGAILLECLGLTHDADLGGAFGYIQSYAKGAKKDTVKACIEVLDRVCNCVKLILDTAESSVKTEQPAELSVTA